MRRKPRITAKQVGGDDGYQYAVFIDGKEWINGLTRSEVPYYKERAQKHLDEKEGKSNEVPKV